MQKPDKHPSEFPPRRIERGQVTLSLDAVSFMWPSRKEPSITRRLRHIYPACPGPSTSNGCSMNQSPSQSTQHDEPHEEQPMTTHVTCLDAPSNTQQNHGPRPRVRRHRPDIENLLEQMTSRTLQALEESPSYLYANPIVSITCDEPTKKFFSLIRKGQAEWCKQSRTLFSRRQRRRVKNWFTGTEQTKFQKFMSRGLQLTGLLFVNGSPIPQNQWPTPPNDLY